MAENMLIRSEAAADHAVIEEITAAAFSGAEHSSGTEGSIIAALRSAGSLTLSLVAEVGGQAVGHAAFSPVTIAGEEEGWYGLGPVSVEPTMQGKGVGSALIQVGLSRLHARGAKGCVVLGDPGYYSRFGFKPQPGLHFEGVPAEYFTGIAFGDVPLTGNVVYQPAFYGG